MAKMTKAQARKRLLEIRAKAAKILMNSNYDVANSMSINDFNAIDKIVTKCLKRLQ